MSKVLVNEASLSAIGDAIRSKNGTQNTYRPSEMAAAISAIGGSRDGLGVTYAVTAIEASAFEENADITSVSIPETVTSIGAAAFQDCSNITDIYFGANISDLEYGSVVFTHAGENGDGIKVVIGNKVTRVPKYLFSGGYPGTGYSPKVVSVEFERGSICTEIGVQAFYYIDSMTFVAPATLTSIESYALYTSSSSVFDFSACTQIPTLADPHLNASTIYVPAALYDEWIVATNWSNYASIIVAK